MDVVLINEINSSERRRRRRQRQRRHQSEMNTVMSPVGDVIGKICFHESLCLKIYNLQYFYNILFFYHLSTYLRLFFTSFRF